MRFIKKARKIIGRQGDFGDSLGISQSIISDWENGRHQVPAKYLTKISLMTSGEITIEQLLSDHYYKGA